MERNADDTFGATGNLGSSTGGSGSMGSMGSTGGAGVAGAGQTAGGSDYTSTSSQSSTAGQGKLDQAKTAMQDRVGQLRDKARGLQSNLADKLDQGAEKIRQRGQSSTVAAVTGDAGVAVSTDERARMQDSVARGMHKSADWLRNGDLKADIEHQVRENPGRTLLVALGVGYLLGKAFRGRDR